MPADELRVRHREGAAPATFLLRRGAWTPDCDALYRDRRCDAVGWRWSTSAQGRSAEALLALPGLRVLEAELRGVDDSCVGRLTTLEELQLLDRCDNDVDLSALAALRALTYAWHERVHGTDRLAGLRALTVLGFAGRSLRQVVGANASLTDLVMISSGRRPAFDTDGLEGSPALENVRIEGARIRDLRGLGAPPALRTLTLEGPDDGPAPSGLDLAPLARARSLQWLLVTGHGTVRGLPALVGCPDLRGVSVEEAATPAGDVAALTRGAGLEVVERRHGVVHLRRRG